MVIVGSVGAKFLADRIHYPKVWIETRPFDPELPVRGRYVTLAPVVDYASTKETSEGVNEKVSLVIRNGRLTALADPDGLNRLRHSLCGARTCWTLMEPLAYFIPEHIPDPSRVGAGEQLWVEATLPPRGPPRPLRLGIRSDSKIKPLNKEE